MQYKLALMQLARNFRRRLLSAQFAPRFYA